MKRSHNLKEKRVKEACVAFNHGYISAREIFEHLYSLAYRDGKRVTKTKKSGTGHKWNAKTATQASRNRWWKNGKPKPVEQTAKTFWPKKDL